MESQITREAAWELLKKYNKDPFHLQHALTVEGVMRWYAGQLGFADEVDFYAHTILRWGITEGFWSKVGKNQNIGDTENIIFRAFIKDDFNNHENRIWEAWYINKEIFPIGKLSKYYRENSDIGLIIPAKAIVGRINTGVFPGTIFDKWEI